MGVKMLDSDGDRVFQTDVVSSSDSTLYLHVPLLLA